MIQEYLNNNTIAGCGSKQKVLWFTGLSGAGKTTLANALYERLWNCLLPCVRLDGDELRNGLNRDLGFTEEDRHENIRRVAEVAKVLSRNGIICIVATISPYESLRENARSIIGKENFYEIFINSPLCVCESRDVKGHYGRARKGLLQLTGIQDRYMAPKCPDLELRTDNETVGQSAERLFAWVIERIRERID